MLRYATREEEVDQLLRGKVFIDLHGVVKQGVRASVEQYSLKELERFCGYRRKVPLPEANQARHFIEHQLELSPSPVLTDEACRVVEGYNEDDCRATERLRHWLEELRAGIVAAGTDIPRPDARDTSASEEVTAHQQRVAALFDALTRDLPAEPTDRTPEQAARWLLAHALDWHRREEKVKWWEFFRMKEFSDEELLDEKTALAGLSFRQRMPKMSPRERAPIDQYHYPPQECSIRPRDKLYTLDEKRFGTVRGHRSASPDHRCEEANQARWPSPNGHFCPFTLSEPKSNRTLFFGWLTGSWRTALMALVIIRAARDLLLEEPAPARRRTVAGCGG